jgi:hypothetical protein
MKQLVLALAVAVPVTSFAQNTELSGKWREIRRTELTGSSLDLRDTIKMDFLTGGEYTWLKKGGFIYRGTYKVENGMLDLGSRTFTLVRQTPDRLVLQDDAAVYEFAPYVEAPRARLPRETASAPVTDIRQMAGKWKVFKGTSSRTMKEIDLSTRVKTVMIYDTPNADGNLGYISVGKDPEGKPSWNITRFANGMLYTSGRSNGTFEVIKADDKELVMREGNITYFLKQFRE